MGLSGLEPPTSRLSGGRSNRLSYKPILVLAQFPKPKGSLDVAIHGGDKRDRTADPLLAKQVLSQLSYTPICSILDFEPESLMIIHYSISIILSSLNLASTKLTPKSLEGLFRAFKIKQHFQVKLP